MVIPNVSEQTGRRRLILCYNIDFDMLLVLYDFLCLPCSAFLYFLSPQPPRRRKTLWDFLLDEMRLVATDYHEEKKLAKHLTKGIAQRAKFARRELCEVQCVHLCQVFVVGLTVHFFVFIFL